MRKFELAIPVLALATMALVGCRQTTGSNSLTPIGPLAPVSAGQTPILGPFGGPTRVTPPPTGSFNPNPGAAYLGAPPNTSGQPSTFGQPNAFGQPGGTNPAFGAPPPSTSSFNPRGSSVQAASWTETGAAMPEAAKPSDPRSGGMPVIDLTGAPNPPGYQPSFQAPQPTGYSNQPYPNQQYSNQGYPNQGYSNQGYPNQPSTNAFPSQPTVSPQSSWTSNAQTNLNPINQAPQPQPRSQPFNPVPSTASQNLPWRAPGSGF